MAVWKLMSGVTCAAVLVASGCSKKSEPTAKTDDPTAEADEVQPTGQQESKQARKSNMPSRVLWGDTHLHTSYSPDAFFMGTTTLDPDAAYRYAKGESLTHPITNKKVRIGTPLDFLVVADHSELMGIPYKIQDGDSDVANMKRSKRWKKMMDAGKGAQVFTEEMGAAINENKAIPEYETPKIRRSTWERIIDAAERHNAPGKFTAFIGWEWTSTPGGKNLHRVVFTDKGGDTARKFLPFSSFDSAEPEKLWAWLDEASAKYDAPFVAIPHNSNISGGLMFPEHSTDGKPVDAAYAALRMKWEPVVEVTQIKGDSETDPMLSPGDEFADFEAFRHMLDFETLGKESGQANADDGDFVRRALLRGLSLHRKIGANPYKFGMIGSTDAHTGMPSAEEDNFMGKFLQDGTAEGKFKDLMEGLNGKDMSASGLAAVWAAENTREAIFDAFRRKEVYATTGPRMQVRLFGGWDYTKNDADAVDLAERGYARGVPMGGDLTRADNGGAPTFLVHAAKDPVGANLDRIQIVKGWIDDSGEAQEKVYNVVWSGNRRPDTHEKLPAVGNTVDLKTGKVDNSIGESELAGVFVDPDFNPKQRAFYYVRVLQIPTARHTLYAAIVQGIEHPKDIPSTIQERAYTSPIWYTP